MSAPDDALETIAHLRRRAYRPVLVVGDGQPTDCKLGGTAYLAAGTSLPRCPRCSSPMALRLQLNPAQFPEPLRKEFGSRLIQLFQCPALSSCSGRSSAATPHDIRSIEIDGEAEAKAPGPATNAATIRSWSPIDDYPDRDEPIRQSLALSSEQDDALEGVTDRADKLSGWAASEIKPPKCSACQRRMRLVFQLGGDGENAKPTAGLLSCPSHKETLAFAWADAEAL